MSVIVGEGLSINNLHPNDEGVYECRADNVIGKITSSVQLSIQAPPIMTVTPEKSVMATQGDEIVLRCLTTGRPTPSIFWTVEGDEHMVLFPGLSQNNIFVSPDGSLKIKDSKPKNSGMYSCTTVNEVGSAIAISHVSVSDSAGKLSASQHSDLKIPTYKMDTDDARLTLQQQQVVQILSLQSTGANTVEISWRILGLQTFVEGLLVRYRKTKSRYQDFKTDVITDIRSSQHNLENLEPNSEYDIFIQPFYRTIVGAPTPIHSVNTQASNIPGPPNILVAEMLNVSTAFVVWESRVDDRITGYEVLLKNNGSSISTQVDPSFSEVYLKLNVHDFQQTYQVMVSAISDLGKSLYSKPAPLHPTQGVPVGVTQPDVQLDEMDSSLWVVVLIGSLTLILASLTLGMLYYRFMWKNKQRRYLTASGEAFIFSSSKESDFNYLQEKELSVQSDQAWVETKSSSWQSQEFEEAREEKSRKKTINLHLNRQQAVSPFPSYDTHQPHCEIRRSCERQIDHQQLPSIHQIDQQLTAVHQLDQQLSNIHQLEQLQAAQAQKCTESGGKQYTAVLQLESGQLAEVRQLDGNQLTAVHCLDDSPVGLRQSSEILGRRRIRGTLQGPSRTRLHKESASFDGVQRNQNKKRSRMRKSNPNLLDIIPPPPRYAPPSPQPPDGPLPPTPSAKLRRPLILRSSQSVDVPVPTKLSYYRPDLKRSHRSLDLLHDHDGHCDLNKHFSCVEPRRNYSSTSLEYLDQLLIDDIDDQNQVLDQPFTGHQDDSVDYILKHELKSFNEAVTNFKGSQF